MIETYDRDTLCLHLVLQDGASRVMAEAAAKEAFKSHARIRADAVVFVDALPDGADLIVNFKDG